MKLFVCIFALFAVAAAQQNIEHKVIKIDENAPKRKVDVCELVNAMVAAGFPRADMEDWACLAKHESSFETSAIGGPNSNGSYDYGIFQINNNYWCSPGGLGNDCNVACSSLVDTDISNDISCARIIFNRHGFNAWYGWINNCQGAKDPVDHCFK